MNHVREKCLQAIGDLEGVVTMIETEGRDNQGLSMWMRQLAERIEDAQSSLAQALKHP